jgi:hypothetical protein
MVDGVEVAGLALIAFITVAVAAVVVTMLVVVLI